MEQVQPIDFIANLSEYKMRARNAGYKNALPKLPKSVSQLDKPISGHEESCISGFRKRTSNWLNGLYAVESSMNTNQDGSLPGKVTS